MRSDRQLQIFIHFPIYNADMYMYLNVDIAPGKVFCVLLCTCLLMFVYLFTNVCLLVYRTELKLEGLEDACVLEDEDNDKLSDKHGCPAYVSPEILVTVDSYSGKAADVWSIGVMLYTMLIGRYPFHDTEAAALFTKIRRGLYSIPDTISSRAKCLIKNLLRRNPRERLRAEDIISHPWFSHTPRLSGQSRGDRDTDQLVPQSSLTKPKSQDPLFL